MKTAKLFIMSCLATTFALGCSISYAKDNADPVQKHTSSFHNGSFFVSGNAGISNNTFARDKIFGCAGNCSANPIGTIGIGYGFTGPGGIIAPNRFAISIEYSQQQFNINGNVLDVNVKALTLAPGESFGPDDRFIIAFPIQFGLVTSGIANLPSRTVFGGTAGMELLYQVNPRLYLSVGFYDLNVSAPNLPDFYSNTANIGLRWHP